MIVDEGLLALLRYILIYSGIDTRIGLFTNAYTPVNTTTMGDLTEASFGGYAQLQADGITWPAPAINGDGNGETDGPTLTWTLTGDLGSPLDVTGIFVTIKDDTGATRLLFAYKFATPVTIELSGDMVQKKLNWFSGNLA